MATTPTPPTPPQPAAAAGAVAYPVLFDVEYPDRKLNRVTTFFRLLLAIPVLILLGLLQQTMSSTSTDYSATLLAAGGIIFVPTVLLLLCRHRYPRWWFDFNTQLLAFGYRVSIYTLFMNDEYPSTEDPQTLRLTVPYPNAKEELSRGLPLVKWLLAFPHYIVLGFLWIALLVVVTIAWFAILFTGRYPRGMFDFVVGVLRWSTRVTCYAFLLTTDHYPPFSLKS